MSLHIFPFSFSFCYFPKRGGKNSLIGNRKHTFQLRVSERNTIQSHPATEYDLVSVHFYGTFLPYSPGLLNFCFSDDSEATPGQDLGKHDIGGVRTLRSAEASETAGLAGGSRAAGHVGCPPVPQLIFLQSLGRLQTLWEPGVCPHGDALSQGWQRGAARRRGQQPSSRQSLWL